MNRETKLRIIIDMYKAYDLPVQRSQGIIYPKSVHDELKRIHDEAVRELEELMK